MRAGLVQIDTAQIDTAQIDTEPLWHRRLVWCDWRDERGYLRALRGGTPSPGHQTGSPTPMH